MIKTEFGPWFEIDEVAERAGLTPRRVTEGRLPAVRIAGWLVVPGLALDDFNQHPVSTTVGTD